MRYPAPLLAAALLLASCAPAPEPARDYAAEVAALAEEAWRELLAKSPYLQLKHGRLVRRLPDLDRRRLAADVAFARSLLERLDAIPAAALAPEDALTHAVLRWDAEQTVAGERFYWLSFPFTPYVAGLNLQFVHQAFASYAFDAPESHAAAYLGLIDEYAAMLDQMRAHLEGQIERGIYLPRPALPGVIGLFRAFRDGARGVVAVAPERLGAFEPAARQNVVEAVERRIAERLEPAFDALLARLESAAYRERAPLAVGLAQYPDGEAYYRFLVRAHTTMDVTPEALHELGTRRVAELAAEMAAIRDQLGFRGTQAEFHRQLRRDPRFLAATPEDVEARFRDYLARLEPRIGELFRRLPRAPYDVRRLDQAAEGSMTFGYYQPPTAAEPVGLYRYNGSHLDQRSLIFAGPLIYHELIPGHHFHLALQGENESLPLYRREYLGASAFNEGWGNYGAYLAREIGLLDDPYDRYGWAIFDMFISVRLVVDTGMNLLGWSLEEGREYMRRYTFQSDAEIATETLRYATDLPGQALAYKAGLEKLLELRRRAQEAAGDAFDLRDFHDAVLAPGALPLSILEENLSRRFPSGSGPTQAR